MFICKEGTGKNLITLLGRGTSHEAMSPSMPGDGAILEESGALLDLVAVLWPGAVL